jgi:predicted acyltransferase
MTNYNRISSIDIMRGITLIIMLFVNDLYMRVAPAWLGNSPENADSMGLADWVFPGFLFVAGLAIPFALSRRFSAGENTHDIGRHIILRFISLIIIGILMLNSGRIDAELAGMNATIWTLMMYIGIFMIWNDYRDKENRFFTVTGFRLFGMAVLAFLVFKFNSGEPENNGSLITGWWGYLGLLGWGYLVSAFAYVLFRDSILKTALLAGFFLALNIISGLDLIKLPSISIPFGVLIDGNVPFMVLTGLLAGLIIKKFQINDFQMAILSITLLGIVFLAAGFILRNWFIISKVNGTPSWVLICSGINLLVFVFLFWIADVKKLTGWAVFMRPAAENSLTAYLSADVIYYIILSTGIPLLIYKQTDSQLIVIAGSLIWAFLIVKLTALLKRLDISLKL